MRYLFIILLLIWAGTANADKFIMQMECYPKKVQSTFLKYGYKIDLSGTDRDKDSYGFIVNEGAQFIIYTYKPASQEELEQMVDILNDLRIELIKETNGENDG